uniref:Ig-like domain-containing protein n=1 Tax=Cyprinus carpio TaxID=7962 RepID=A0A8C1GXQ8_CYPCA
MDIYSFAEAERREIKTVSAEHYERVVCVSDITVDAPHRQKICDMQSNIGSPAKFECEIEETPNVTFKWFKSGSEIRQSDKFRVISRQSTSSLELLNPTKDDAGEYSCRASNKHGSDTCSAKLNFTGEYHGTFSSSSTFMTIGEKIKNKKKP